MRNVTRNPRDLEVCTGRRDYGTDQSTDDVGTQMTLVHESDEESTH